MQSRDRAFGLRGFATGARFTSLIFSITEMGAGPLSERRKAVGDSEEEDDADDETVGGAGPGDDVVETRMVVAAGVEGSAHGGGHQGVHGYQAQGEGRQAHHA